MLEAPASRYTRAVRAPPALLALLLPVLVAGPGCDRTTSLIDPADSGAADAESFDFADANPGAADAGRSAGCVSGGNECNNCLDDDGDGRIDGFDPECTGAIDDDEASFATGIDNDNVRPHRQDCYFDGDSANRNDGCRLHLCCLLDGVCPDFLRPGQFDPDDCTPSDRCAANCAPLAPPGCDCFGCCRLCNDEGCFSVVTHPEVAPDCTAEVADDRSKCPRCSFSRDCGRVCGPNRCILCPGMDEADLPANCSSAVCPPRSAVCSGQADCAADEYCADGCCIRAIVE